MAALIGFLAWGLVNAGDGGIATGEPVPTNTLPTLPPGAEGSLADYRGEWVLLNVWASWCLPCRDESPALDRFERENRARIAVHTLTISRRPGFPNPSWWIRKATWSPTSPGRSAALRRSKSSRRPRSIAENPRGPARDEAILNKARPVRGIHGRLAALVLTTALLAGASATTAVAETPARTDTTSASQAGPDSRSGGSSVAMPVQIRANLPDLEDGI